IDASPFSGNAGGPPGTGQFFIAIDPAASDGFDARIARLAAAFHAEAAAHLPGDGRKAKRAAARGEGVAVNLETYKKIQSIVT
ncbi:MAG: Ldh family oxidoreductase, partial [Pseudomonadota bacterium]